MRPARKLLLMVFTLSLTLVAVVLSVRTASQAAADGVPLGSAVSMLRASAAQASADVLTTSVYLPLLAHSYPVISLDILDRQSSLEFYKQVYLSSEGTPIDWTGDHATCGAGTTSAAFKEAVRRRINYYRAMAGVPDDIAVSDEYSAKAQQAALMMSVNDALSHTPPSDWDCYTTEGAEAASSSNLGLGMNGWYAIDAYMYDGGLYNTAVGHRRWILYPQTQSMGTGDIPYADGYSAANALWVFDEHIWEPRPATREEYVAWPPPGYVPYQLVPQRWSFSYDDASFAEAKVTMTKDGAPLNAFVDSPVDGYGENTLVFRPAVPFTDPPSADTAYTVQVANVKIGTSYRSFSYTVIVFDPGVDSASAVAAPPAGQLGTPPEPR